MVIWRGQVRLTGVKLSMYFSCLREVSSRSRSRTTTERAGTRESHENGRGSSYIVQVLGWAGTMNEQPIIGRARASHAATALGCGAPRTRSTRAKRKLGAFLVGLRRTASGRRTVSRDDWWFFLASGYPRDWRVVEAREQEMGRSR